MSLGSPAKDSLRRSGTTSRRSKSACFYFMGRVQLSATVIGERADIIIGEIIRRILIAHS